MKFRISGILFALVIILVTSCSDHGGPKGAMTIDATNAVASPYDVWYFISDRGGNVLDTRHETTPEKFTLSAGVQYDTVSLTMVQVFGTPDNYYLSVTTLGAIPLYSVLPSPFTYKVPIVEGTCQITITNNANNNSYNNSVISVPHDVSVDHGLLTAYNPSVDLYADTTFIFISAYSAGKPVYKSFNGAKNGDNLSMDLADMKPFPATLNFPATVQTADVWGNYGVGPDYAFQRLYEVREHGKLRSGRPERFSKKKA